MSNVLKVGKKMLTVGTVMSTMLWSVGVAALLPVAASAATCPTFKSGDLLKVTGKPAIYAVDSNGKVLYFPSGDEFKSWNVDEKYGGYTTVSQECYDLMPVPSVSPYGVNYRPGSFTVKRASSDQLYVVEPGNVLAKITVDAANALYGIGHKTMTVADVFWPNYSATRGADVTEAKVHPGMLVSNGGKTWYVSTNSQLQEVTVAGMSANRFKTTFVRPVAASAVAGLTVGTTLDASNAILADRTQTGGGSAVIPGTVVTSGALTVSLAASNPAGVTLASGSSFNQVLKLNLTAGSQDVNVTGLTLRKGGFVANSNISGIDLIDSAGNRHGNVASSVNTDNDVTLLFANAPIVVKAGTTEVVTVRANLLAGAYSSTVSFGVLSASSVASNGSIGGSFPVSGNAFSIQDGSNSLGNATLNIASVNTAGATLNVDANNQQEIAKFTLAQVNSKEAIKLSKLTLYNNGTAADSDVADVQLVAQDGSVLATAQQVSKNVVFDLSASPYSIDKGQSKNFTVRAKIVNGAARTIQFVVYNDYDVVVTGTSTLTSILPTTTTGGTSGTATTFPVGNKTSYNLVTVGSGSISFNKDTSSPSSAVTPNASNVVLAKYFAKPSGESMELRKIALGFVVSTSTNFSGSFTVKVNGASVYSGTPGDIANSSTALTTLTLSTYPTLTAGQNNYITVEANINSSAVNGATTIAYLDLTEVKRLVTNDIVDPGVGISAANQVTIQAAALKITTLATPVAQSIVVGSSNVILAQVELNPSSVSSGEDVRVNKVVFTDTLGASALATDIANLALYDQNGNVLVTSASTAINSTTLTFTLVNPITIAKSGSVVLTLKGDVVANAASGTHTFKVGATGDVTATGQDTGNTPALTLGTGSGQALTIADAGTLTLSLASGANAAPANAQIVTVGQTNVSVFAFKLSAQKEPMKVTSLTLTASGTLRTVNNLTNLKLYRNNETTPFASATQMVSNASGTTSTVFTWTASSNLLPDAIEPSAPVTIYVKADIGKAGEAILGDNFAFSIKTPSTDVVAKGASSGASASTLGTAAVSGLSYVAPFSVTVSLVSPANGSSLTQGVIANTQLATVKVYNGGSSKVTVTGIKFTDTGTHTGTSTTYKLLYSDEGSSVTATVASSTASTTDFSGLATTFDLNGGATRYVTVSINAIGAAVTGDSWQLAIASIGDLTYTVTEADFGFDTNNSGGMTGSSYSLFADGKPSMGAFVKS